ncbi:MAG: M20 family metallopeptidase [Chloroflexi bacterium]|nr:M20 family metallopeptidase [Chloroflexota bacterium]
MTVPMKDRLAAAVEARTALLDDLALRIHAHPELAFEERYASGALVAALRSEGVDVSTGTAGMETAFLAEAGTAGAVVALFAEYDALPGVGHACGHNLMGTASLGAFLALRDVLAPGSGRVRLLGSPAEERGNGKFALIKAGLLNDVDAAMMFHAGDRDESDPLMLAFVTLDVRFHGVAAHAAARPHEGVNALDALLLAWSGISALRQVIRSEARIHGIITEGGVAPNIIPERSAARFMIRSADNAYLEELCRRVMACFEGAALATGCRLEYEFSEVCEMVSTNHPLADAFTANAHALGRTMHPRRPGEMHGSTDMGNVTTVVPAIHPFLAITDVPTPGHSHRFTEAARAPAALATMRLAAKALAMTALDVLTDDSLRVRSRAAFEGRR